MSRISCWSVVLFKSKIIYDNIMYDENTYGLWMTLFSVSKIFYKSFSMNHCRL